jgi:ATP-dependent RNA helicase DDX10/DBP4
MQTHKKHQRNISKNRDAKTDLKKERFEEDLMKLEERLKNETPPSGYVYKYDPNDKLETDPSKKSKVFFKDLAISYKTLRGLTESKFVKMTPIQRSVIPHALANREIIGASKTGSGKTLSYIIPVLEILYRSRWSKLDGLGALIIVPTRELALQVVFSLI